MYHRLVIRYVILCIGVCVVVLCSSPAATQDRFPEAPGKSQLLKSCGSCHEAETVLAQALTVDGWAETLTNMMQFGAEASPDEWRLIQQYLDSQLAVIAINKAAAEEIQRTMEVPGAVARDIVAYRRDNGNFKSADDLKKVPGLDAAKVESRRSRLIF